MQTVGAEVGFIPRATSRILSMNNKGLQTDPWGIPVGRFVFWFGSIISQASAFLLLDPVSIYSLYAIII